MKNMPDKRGYYGEYGGRFVPESLVNALYELEAAYRHFLKDPAMRREHRRLLADYAGRPTPVYHARRLSAKLGLELYLKREDLVHTGSHKLNNTLGQILLTRYMGKRRVIAETGAGQHGVATATAAALMGMECRVYMGAEDVARQAPNVHRMALLGAEVVPVETGQRTLKDAVSEAMRDWVASVRGTHYLIGSVIGPAPFPRIVRDFQSVIGREARAQMHRMTGRDPDTVVACVGGGSNAAGIFGAYLGARATALVGVEAGGRSHAPGDHSASLGRGRPGIFQGSRTYLLQTDEGQVLPVHSISAGLDYSGVGPEHSYLKDSGAVRYAECSDTDTLEACLELTRTEGIIPALESSHALGYVIKNRRGLRGKTVLVNLSGRGDKDMGIIEEAVKA
jgi:tryptophan synthase beta chain